MSDYRPWTNPTSPKRILVIRFQAMGDVTITLPYIATLRLILPTARIDFLTCDEVADIPRQMHGIDSVYAVGGGRDRRLQYLAATTHLPRLMATQYDVVADLQNNRLSRYISWAVSPSAWSRFDRFSPLPAGIRTQHCLERLDIGPILPRYNIKSKSAAVAIERLRAAGYTSGQKLLALNPAGFFESRNWPIENYITFARLWMERHSDETRFLLLGLDRIRDKTETISRELGEHCINLVGQTTAAEAFALVGQVNLMLSEDSGLMHMAWVSGVPTVALFGSSRGDWSRPLGEHSICLDSSDLDCGCCMLESCKFGHTKCLSRHTPEKVVDISLDLLSRLRGRHED